MAKPSDNSTLEHALGGLPLVRDQGLNTNNAVNFSGWTVSTGGNASIPAGGTTSGSVTGPTGSFNALNIQTAAVVGQTGATALPPAVGASGGGPTTAQSTGWTVVYVAGVKSWIPYWQ